MQNLIYSLDFPTKQNILFKFHRKPHSKILFFHDFILLNWRIKKHTFFHVKFIRQCIHIPIFIFNKTSYFAFHLVVIKCNWLWNHILIWCLLTAAIAAQKSLFYLWILWQRSNGLNTNESEKPMTSNNQHPDPLKNVQKEWKSQNSFENSFNYYVSPIQPSPLQPLFGLFF